MGINTPSDISAELSIGPTDQKMVRVFVTADGMTPEGIEIPMDFLPMKPRKLPASLWPPRKLVGNKSGASPFRNFSFAF